MDITSLAQLTKYAEGQVVELPSFAADQPFVARIRRPSMLALAKSGKIPNSLLKTANGLFLGDNKGKQNEEYLQDVFDVLDVICEACFIEPTWKELQEAGIELTDDQYMFIFNYSQTGVRALEPFRQQQANSAPAGNIQEVQ